MKSVRMTYTNYKGETSVRNVVPIRVDFGTTEWHPEPQWLMSAYDEDKKAHREFALSDCDFTST
jgi:predicted DNA-binding transcriptional regulator YafY